MDRGVLFGNTAVVPTEGEAWLHTPHRLGLESWLCPLVTRQSKSFAFHIFVFILPGIVSPVTRKGKGSGVAFSSPGF